MASPVARAEMPMSPAGASDPGVIWRRAARGLSLIELLVVLVIVATVVAGTVLSVSGSGEREVENAARRAQSLIRLACERALIGGRDIGFSVVRDGLRFGYFEIDGWHPRDDTGSDELRARPLGRDLLLAAYREGIALPLPDEPEREPAFACLSSGELTPFVLHIDRPDAQQRWQLEGSLDGELLLQQVQREQR
ncbi:MAG: prepilin-type N-terminal cleavage/methylation domain-containing protein [Lysobacteraceae bacterium]